MISKTPISVIQQPREITIPAAGFRSSRSTISRLPASQWSQFRLFLVDVNKQPSHCSSWSDQYAKYVKDADGIVGSSKTLLKKYEGRMIDSGILRFQLAQTGSPLHDCTGTVVLLHGWYVRKRMILQHRNV